ncbi:hypothetical protein PBY51_013599 [Eleginops maclovinus]|nr:hypothetical protein PBY51_013599 [Eleginops maclovinus]
MVNAWRTTRWGYNLERPEDCETDTKADPKVHVQVSRSPKVGAEFRGESPSKRAAYDYQAAPQELPENKRQKFHKTDRESEEVAGELTEDDEDSEEDGEGFRVDTSDEFYCDYDSTWETYSRKRRSRGTRRPAHRNSKFSRFENAAKDMQNYRHDYPSLSKSRWNESHSDEHPNLMFYLGKRRCVPDDALIMDFHNNWHGDYNRLEHGHSYIQWLFPLQEPGMNYQARTLTKEEIWKFLNSKIALAYLLESYKLMLDFYGIELFNEQTGEVRRRMNWKDRFDNLNRHTHNNLRITRILKCLGTLGYAHYQAPLVRFFLKETIVHRELPSIKESVLSYFVFTVLDKKERRLLIKYAYSNYDRRDEFVWCPKKIQMKWSRESAPVQKTYL